MRHFRRCSAYAFPCRPLAARWQTRKVPYVASRSALKHSARSAFTASASEPCELARTAQYEMAEYGGTDIFFSSRGRSSHFVSVSGGFSRFAGGGENAPGAKGGGKNGWGGGGWPGMGAGGAFCPPPPVKRDGR